MKIFFLKKRVFARSLSHSHFVFFDFCMGSVAQLQGIPGGSSESNAENIDSAGGSGKNG